MFRPLCFLCAFFVSEISFLYGIHSLSIFIFNSYFAFITISNIYFTASSTSFTVLSEKHLLWLYFTFWKILQSFLAINFPEILLINGMTAFSLA